MEQNHAIVYYSYVDVESSVSVAVYEELGFQR